MEVTKSNYFSSIIKAISLELNNAISTSLSY